MSNHRRIEVLLNRMTLEEKVCQMDMIRGVQLATKPHPAHFCAIDEDSDFYWDQVDRRIGSRGIGFIHDVYGIPKVLNRLQHYLVEKTRMGIPAIFTGEALHGLSYPGAMSFPMPICLGAYFDPAIAKEVGEAIAAESRALGIHEILAPNLDVARDPRWGRMEETFGEDTFLAREMGRAIIRGEQGDSLNNDFSVAAEPKHYLAYGFPESGLNCAPARAGEREILSEYLPVFQAGVQEAGAYNAMAAYHSIDGTPLICSYHYLTEVLKGQLALKGYIRSDFGAINRLRIAHHLTDNDLDSIALSVNAGLDVQGFDYPNDIWQNGLIKLIRDGRIPIERIDDAVRRVLLVKFELGLFDHPYTDEKRYTRVVRCDKHRDICLRAAREGMTLLKNDGVLPIGKDVKTIALIGPSGNRQRLGSYASVPYNYHVSTVYEELKKALPNVDIRQEDGCGISERDFEAIPADWLRPGVEMSYFADNDFTKAPVGSSIATEVNFNWGLAKPHPALPFTGYGVRMSGTITPTRTFHGILALPCQDSVRLFVDGALLIESWGEKKQHLPHADFHFITGRTYAFTLEYRCDVNGRNAVLSYCAHTEDSMEQAVMLAENADLTILMCGDDTMTSGEGMDRRELTLYGLQRQLAARVGALGKPTVLVLTVGKAVDLSREAATMNAILLPWFGGEKGAQAIAEALTGAINPSGRLPISFPSGVGSLPCYYSRLPGGHDEYLEGKSAPMFPFGHGLSYTAFALSALSASVVGERQAVVCFTIANTGSRPGIAVPQLYVNDCVSSVVVPDKRLCAFERVPLTPGEKREVSFRLHENAFRLMNERREWAVEPGEFMLYLGFSSQDIRLRASVILRG